MCLQKQGQKKFTNLNCKESEMKPKSEKKNVIGAIFQLSYLAYNNDFFVF